MKTEKGKVVSVSLYDAAVSSLVNQASNYLMNKHIPQRIGSLHPNIAPYGELFKTADGKLITFAIGSQTHFEKLVLELDLKELLTDSRFINNQSRVENRKALAEVLQTKITSRNAEELLNKLHLQFVPCAEIKNLKDVFKNPESRDLVREEVIDGKITKRVTSIAFKYEN